MKNALKKCKFDAKFISLFLSAGGRFEMFDNPSLRDVNTPNLVDVNGNCDFTGNDRIHLEMLQK